MLNLFKQVFIVLLRFSILLACNQTKCMFLNDEPCMVRPTLIDMSTVELKYYPLEVVMSYLQKDMITNKIEAKAMTEHISLDCKCKFNSTTCNSKQKWNNKVCQCECKNYLKPQKDYSWNPSICICENGKYLKSIADTSVTECDEIIIVMDIVSTKMTNTIAANITSTPSINCYSKKVRYCHILHTVLLVIILLLIIIIICYYYAKQKGTI